MCVYVSFWSKVRSRNVGCVALIFRMVWSEQRASCFVWILCENVMFCLDTNFIQVGLYVYLGCTRACVCWCDGDVICVGHDLKRCSGWW